MYKSAKQFFNDLFDSKDPFLFFLIQRYRHGVRYSVAGVTSAGVVLATLYVLTDIVGLWYLASAVLGQVGGFFTNFFLQKYWTFKDYRKETTERQFKLFVAISAIHIVLNAVAMVALVEIFRLWYLLAQITVLTVLALGSFVFHKKVTFKDNGNGEY